MPPAVAADYAESAFAGVLRGGALDPAAVAGMRVLELGPGDNVGLALRFVASGAREVVTLDRFEIGRDPARERGIYDEVIARLPKGEAARARTALEPSAGLLRSITGLGAEAALEVLERESFDLILSVAVLEHVDDLDASFDAMDALLRPGGLMLHQVDFRDHGMFSGGGQHPLTFLTIGERTWRAMTSGWGGPNRRLIDYYRVKLAELGYDARLLVSEVLGVEEHLEPCDVLEDELSVTDEQRRSIARIRDRLQPEFRDLPDEDLVPEGVFVVARKPV